MDTTLNETQGQVQETFERFFEKESPPERVRAAEPLGFEHRAAPLTDADALDAALRGVTAVLHAAGPFSATSAPMIRSARNSRGAPSRSATRYQFPALKTRP